MPHLTIRFSRPLVFCLGLLIAGWPAMASVQAASEASGTAADRPAAPEPVAPHSISSYTRSAGQVFRGRCIAARDTTVELGGGQLPATDYVFEVVDGLKGVVGERVEFRQIGRRDGGVEDLGRRVGLPIYAPGEEYVLFLLPPSAVGLTSPAGAAEGAFSLQGESLRPMSTGHGVRLGGMGEAAVGAEDQADGASRSAPADAAAVEPVSDYRSLRRIVLAEGER